MQDAGGGGAREQDVFLDALEEAPESRAAFVRRACAAEDVGADDFRTAACVRDLVDLYTLWNDAEPGSGHLEAAAHWESQRP